MMKLKSGLITLAIVCLSLNQSALKITAQIRDTQECVYAYVEINKLRNQIRSFVQKLQGHIQQKSALAQALQNGTATATKLDIAKINDSDVAIGDVVSSIIVKAESYSGARYCQVNTSTSYNLLIGEVNNLIAVQNNSMRINNTLYNLAN